MCTRATSAHSSLHLSSFESSAQHRPIFPFLSVRYPLPLIAQQIHKRELFALSTPSQPGAWYTRSPSTASTALDFGRARITTTHSGEFKMSLCPLRQHQRHACGNERLILAWLSAMLHHPRNGTCARWEHRSRHHAYSVPAQAALSALTRVLGQTLRCAGICRRLAKKCKRRLGLRRNNNSHFLRRVVVTFGQSPAGGPVFDKGGPLEPSPPVRPAHEFLVTESVHRIIGCLFALPLRLVESAECYFD